MADQEDLKFFSRLYNRWAAFYLDSVAVFFLALPFGVFTIYYTNYWSEPLLITLAAVVLCVTLYSFLIYPLYFALLESRGSSPGKRLKGLKVVDEEGGKPSIIQAFLRHVLDPFSAFAFWIPDLITMYRNEGRRIGDLLAGTRVIKESN